MIKIFFVPKNYPSCLEKEAKMAIYVMGDNNPEEQKTRKKKVRQGLVTAINRRREL